MYVLPFGQISLWGDLFCLTCNILTNWILALLPFMATVIIFIVLIQVYLTTLAKKNNKINLPRNNLMNSSKIYYNKNRNYSTRVSSTGTLDSWWVTGFADGERSFIIGISEKTDRKLACRRHVHLTFQIELHLKDMELLEKIRKFFCCGSLYPDNKRNICKYKVCSLELIIILPHFDKYPLISQKKADYLFFKEVALIIKQKKHLNIEGLINIYNIKASSNLGLTPKLPRQNYFPQAIPVPRPIIKDQTIINPKWFRGFSSAERCFTVQFSVKKSNTAGYCETLLFEIGQHGRDYDLVKSFISYLGRIFRKKKNYTNFKVFRFSDIENKIIPFFLEHKIIGSKSLDFIDWCKVLEIIKAKKHLTMEGVTEIRKIHNGKNSGRLKSWLLSFYSISTSASFFPFVCLAGPISISTSVETIVAIISTLIFLIGLAYDLAKGLVNYTQRIPKRIPAISRVGPHNKDIICIIYGILLGDSHAERRAIGNGTRISVQQESNRSEYLLWLHDLLAKLGYCNPNSPKVQSRMGPKGIIRYIIRFHSYTYSSFNTIHEAWYNKGIKRLPSDISEYLSPLALAILIINDGTRVGKGLKLATNSFTYEDSTRLTQVLYNLYKLKAVVQSAGVPNQYVIYIWKESMPQLRELVRPFMVSSILYKLGEL